MKKYVFFLFISISMFVISSCQQDEDVPTVVPGIVYTNDPPEELFSGGTLYATTDRCWVDALDFLSAKSLGYNYNRFYYEDGSSSIYDAGEWYQMSSRKFWGIMGGIIYLSESKDWYIVRPSDFIQGKELINTKKTAIGYICSGANNPYGSSYTIRDFDEY